MTQEIYLKGYYGYKNLGDALLLIGVVEYLYQEFGYTNITVEVQDVDWAQHWYDENSKYFPRNITLTRKKTPGVLGKVVHMLRSAVGMFPLLVLGGGEVVNTGAKFPHNGRNYIILYRGNIIRKQYLLMGGITTQGADDGLAGFLIRNAREVIVRESGSYQQARNWCTKTVLYQDFAQDLIQTVYATTTVPPIDSSYVLINLHPSKVNEKLWKKIDSFLSKHPEVTVYFVPCDMVHDTSFVQTLQKRYPAWVLYDWTKHTIEEIVGFFAGARAAWGMRLHFLLLCHECQVPFDMVVYHDKVRKVLGLSSKK